MKSQNTTKLWKRTVLDKTKRLFSVILTSAMVFTNVGTGLNTVYASDADTVEFTVDSSQLLSAVEDAIADSQEVTAVDMDFTNGKIDEFEEHFFGSGKLLEAFPETEGGSMDAELRVFIRVPEDADETYMVTGSEDVIFLYVNNGDDTIRCTTSITRTEDGEEKVKKTRSITVKDFESAYGDEDVNYISKPIEQPETSIPETQAPVIEETETVAPENETTAPTESETVEPETEATEESEAAPSEEDETTAPETEETETETETPETEKTDIETTAPEETAETPEETDAESEDTENDTSLEESVPVANISRHEAPVVAWSAFRGGVIDFTAVENFDVAETPETTESENISDDEESTEAQESTEVQESTEAAESTEAQESTEAVESTEAQESTQAVESTEAQESTEAVESTEAQESTEAVESTEAQESTQANTPAAERIPNATSSEADKNKTSSSANADGLVGIGNCSSAKAYSATLSELKVMDEQTIVSTTADDGALIAVSGTPKAMANIAEVQAIAITEVNTFVEQLNSELSAAGEMVDKIAVYDVTVIDHEGNETQPGDEVKVTITVPEFTADETTEIGAFHAKELAEDSQTFEIEIKDADINQAQGTVAMGTDSFSPVGAYTVVSANGNSYNENSWKDSKWYTEPIELGETTDGITIKCDDEDIENIGPSWDPKYRATITITIGENVNNEELNINLNHCLPEIFEKISFYGTADMQPGDKPQFVLKIINKSANTYQYVENSFSFDILDELAANESDDLHSFTGQLIPSGTVAYHMANTALAKVLDCRVCDITSDSVENLLGNGFTFTDKNGISHTYKGLEDLNLFYLDFYNDKYDCNAKRLDELPDEHIAELLGFNPDKFNSVPSDYDGTPLQFPRVPTNREFAETAYNYYYNYCTKAFVNINDYSPSELDDYYDNSIRLNGEYSIGSYMRQYNNQTSTMMEPYFQSSFENIEHNQETVLAHSIVMTLDGEFMTNAYQNRFSIPTFGFKLQKPAPVDGTVTFNGTKVLTGREFTADDAYTFVLKQDGVEVDRTTVKPAETPAFTLTDNLISGEEGTQVVYTISEEGAGTTVDNVTYDNTVYTAAYDITVDDASNTLTATYANGDNLNAGVTFTNVYNEPVTPGGGGSGGGGGDTPTGHRDTPETGGPGVTIDDPQVPLAPAPAENTVTIMDPNVPLAPLPKTGQKNDGLMEALTMIVSGFFLAAALLGRKRTKES